MKSNKTLWKWNILLILYLTFHVIVFSLKGTCHDEVNNFRCSCSEGYLGRTCSNATDECSTMPCQNGATCTDLHRDYNVRAILFLFEVASEMDGMMHGFMLPWCFIFFIQVKNYLVDFLNIFQKFLQELTWKCWLNQWNLNWWIWKWSLQCLKCY